MQFLLSRIAQLLFIYICAAEADETEALYVAIPFLVVMLDVFLKITTRKGLLYHLFNI